MRFQTQVRPTIALIALAIQPGCCQHYCQRYYDPCAPAPVPIQAGRTQVQYGDVCQTDPPLTTAPRSMGQAPARRSAGSINDAPAPRVVVSEPGRTAMSGWRKADPESQAVTKVEGALSSETLRR